MRILFFFPTSLYSWFFWIIFANIGRPIFRRISLKRHKKKHSIVISRNLCIFHRLFAHQTIITCLHNAECDQIFDRSSKLMQNIKIRILIKSFNSPHTLSKIHLCLHRIHIIINREKLEIGRYMFVVHIWGGYDMCVFSRGYCGKLARKLNVEFISPRGHQRHGAKALSLSLACAHQFNEPWEIHQSIN